VVELPASKLKPFLRVIERDVGFEVDRRHFAIVGLCSDCRSASRRRKPAATRPGRARRSSPR
jgi:Fe2+ or Zn2+ uptake regulation protein